MDAGGRDVPDRAQHVEPAGTDTYTGAGGDVDGRGGPVGGSGGGRGGDRVGRRADGAEQRGGQLPGGLQRAGGPRAVSASGGRMVKIGGWTDPAVPGDVVRLEASGTTIRVLVNGVQRLSVSDSAVSGGSPGIYAYASAGDRVQLDAFAAASSSTTSTGVAGYRVYRNGTLVTTTPTTTYANTGLQPTTAYSYTVTAVDGAGNESGAAGPATATTLSLDATPPGAPTGLSATAISSTRMDFRGPGQRIRGQGCQ